MISTYRLALIVLVVAIIIGAVTYQRYRDLTSELNACLNSMYTSMEELEKLHAYSRSLYSNYTVLQESYLKLRKYTESLLANYSAIEEAYLKTLEELRSANLELNTYKELYQALSDDYKKLSKEYEAALHELEMLRGAVKLLVTLHRQFLYIPVASYSYLNGTLSISSANMYYKVAEAWRLEKTLFSIPYLDQDVVYLPTPNPGFILLEVEVYTSTNTCYRIEVANSYYIANYSSHAIYYTATRCGNTTLLVPVAPHQTILRVRAPQSFVRIRYLHIVQET